MIKVRNFLQHRLNPLHVYCRLKSCGLNDKAALRLSYFFERVIYRSSWLGRSEVKQ